jgi:hypothetical protein
MAHGGLRVMVAWIMHVKRVGGQVFVLCVLMRRGVVAVKCSAYLHRAAMDFLYHIRRVRADKLVTGGRALKIISTQQRVGGSNAISNRRMRGRGPRFGFDEVRRSMGRSQGRSGSRKCRFHRGPDEWLCVCVGVRVNINISSQREREKERERREREREKDR